MTRSHVPVADDHDVDKLRESRRAVRTAVTELENAIDEIDGQSPRSSYHETLTEALSKANHAESMVSAEVKMRDD